MILRLVLVAVVVLVFFLFWTGRIPFPKHEVMYSTSGIILVWGGYLLLRYLSIPALGSAMLLTLFVIVFTVFFEDKIINWLKS
ncbi:MAG: hypothetical protein WC878_01250 [Candidatus Paceibacterota bacterium]